MSNQQTLALFRPEEDDPRWRADAACRGAGSDIFFLSRGATDANHARAICNGCPVKAECLEFGLEETFGIWGGTSPRERQKLRRERRKLEGPKVLPFKHGTYTGYSNHKNQGTEPCVYCQAAFREYNMRRMSPNGDNSSETGTESG